MVAANKWGCQQHWFALPQRVRHDIYKAYRVGQEVDLKFSEEYVAAEAAAQAWIAGQVKR